jgi:HAD superfamily hydrolase (TIGR01509 family)
MYKEAIQNYLRQHEQKAMPLKAVLFDMDGVLFDSMPYHASSWSQTMAHFGFNLSEQEAYMYEGRTGASTINIVSMRERGKEATEEEIQAIYAYKSNLFNTHPEASAMPGAAKVLNEIKADGMFSMVVTGSGQASLLNRLDRNYPGIFRQELMVTAFDVKHGKPHPEPYLMALEKGHLQANEAFVVENAPLGVRAAVAAGIFTVAVNTGPLPDEVLLNEGANLLFPSMQAFADAWPELSKEMREMQL